MAKKSIPALSKVTNKEDFLVTGSGVAFYHQGNVVDLRTIDRPTAEALASDDRCSFLKWAPGKGPNAQGAPPAPGKAK